MRFIYIRTESWKTTMANTVTGNIDNAAVTLDNAATETTLKALLLAVSGSTKEMKRLSKLAEKAGIDAKKIDGANTGLGALADVAGNVAPGKLKILGKVAAGLGMVLGDVAASTIKTVSSLGNFAGELVNGTGSVNGLISAFKDLPLGLGVVAGLFAKIAAFQEQNLEAYRQTTNAGINFAGSLTDLRLSTAQMGLTVDEFTAITASNAEAIAAMGMSAETGAQNFRKVNTALITGGLGRELLALGYGFKDINELTANYVKVSGGLSDAQKRDYRSVAASVVAYGKELDVLARLTGKSREQLEQQQIEMTQNANFQAYLNGLDAKERDKANAALRLAMASGGKGAADALMAELMGLPPLTKEAQLYVATMQNGGRSIQEFAKIVKDGSELSVAQNKLDRVFSSAVSGNIKDLKQFETVLRASAFTGEEQGKMLTDVQAAVIGYQKQGLTEQQAITKFLAEERKKQKDINASEAAAAADAQLAIKQLGSELMAALLPAIRKLYPVIVDLTKSFVGFVTKNMPEIKTALTGVAEFMKNLFSEEGRSKILNQIGSGLSSLLSTLSNIIGRKLFDQSDQLSSGENTINAINKFLPTYWAMRAFGVDANFKPSAAPTQSPLVDQIPRARGSIGSTGKIFEDWGKGTKVELHGQEAVITPTQMTSLFAEFAGKISDLRETKTLVDELQTLNKQTTELIRSVKETADYTRKSFDTLKGMNNNLFA